MIDWSSPAEVARRDGIAFDNLNHFDRIVCFDRIIHCLLGLYIWEWVVSLDFEWQFISGKKKFRWPMTFYFLNRYCLLGALIGTTVALNVTVQIDCQALYTFNLCLGNSAIGLASVNLSLRTMVIWSRRWFIVAPLVIIILGHWSLLLRGIVWEVAWLPGVGCAIIEMNSKILAATYLYSMVFDFIVLTLTGYKLCDPAVCRSKFVALIFKDGLVYFAIAFLLNVTGTIYVLLNPNPATSIVANVPLAIASTIVAGRAVRRLNHFTPTDSELNPTTQGSTVAYRSGVSAFWVKKSTTVLKPKDSFHVHSPNADDVNGKVATGDKFDPEAQVIKGASALGSTQHPSRPHTPPYIPKRQ